MTYRTLIFGHRLPNVTPAQFKERYENHMNTLVKEMAGEHFPLSHIRHYVDRPDGQNATILLGTQADIDFDVVAEMIFENKEAFERFVGILMTEENTKKIFDDEARFFDRSRCKTLVMGETEVTERKQ